MSVLWMDNFGLYGTDTALLLNGLYAENTTGTLQASALIDDPDPNLTDTVFRFGKTSNISNVANTLRRVFPAVKTTVGVGARVWLEHLPIVDVTASIPFSFRTAANGTLFNIEIDASGRLVVWRGTIGIGAVTRTTVLGSTAAPVLTANAWQHVEAKVVFSSTVGSVEVRVEGVPVLSLTNINTDPTNAGCLGWAGVNYANGIAPTYNPPFMYMKDLISWDAAGTENNDFLGSVAIYQLDPNSDSTLGWTPSTGATGYGILDNRPPNDTQYLVAGTSVPVTYQGGLTDLPPDVTSVRAVQSVIRAMKVDGGDGNVQVAAMQGVSAALGADRPMSAAFTFHTDVFEEDPATAAPWTPSGVNSMQLRIERTV